MRQASAEQLKKGRRGRPFDPDMKPRQGSHLRKVHDYFMENRGKVVYYNSTPQNSKGVIENLRDFYGLDIRNLGLHKWVLAGEYLAGAVYVDYIAEQLEKTDEAESA